MFAALLWGAPFGTLIGAWVPSMHPVFRAAANRVSNAERVTSGGSASLLDELGMRVNLGDKLTVEPVSGGSFSGTLTWLDDDAMMIGDVLGTIDGTRYARQNIRRVSVRHSPTRKATLIGFLVGSAICLPSAGSDWIDGIVLCGGMGAGVGALIGKGIRHSTVAGFGFRRGPGVPSRPRDRGSILYRVALHAVPNEVS